jgi:hypothetical protein
MFEDARLFSRSVDCEGSQLVIDSEGLGLETQEERSTAHRDAFLKQLWLVQAARLSSHAVPSGGTSLTAMQFGMRRLQEFPRWWLRFGVC